MCANIRIAFEVARMASLRSQARSMRVDIGLGLPVPYTLDDVFPDLAVVGSELASQMSRFPEIHVELELGRYLVADCGIYIVRIVGIKASRGKSFIITDGGIQHFARFALIRRNHTVMIVDPASKYPECHTGPYCVVGHSCTPLDILADNVFLHRIPQIGDYLAVLCTGAYGKTLGFTSFLTHPPARELIRFGSHFEFS